MPTIAQKLVKAGHGVWLMRRDCKEYWLEEDKPKLSLEERFAPKNLERKFAWPQYPAPIQVSAKASLPVCSEPIAELELEVKCPPIERQEKAKIGKVLGRMEYLKQRGNIENPAGFLKDTLWVAWRAKHGFAEIPPKFISPKRRRK